MAKKTDERDYLLAADERFAASVRAIREDREWSQSELAARLRDAGLESFHPTTVSRIENGDRLVRLGEARVIADVLGTLVGVMVAPSQEGLAVQALMERVGDFTDARRRLEAAATELKLERSLLQEKLKEVTDSDFTKWADDDLKGRIEVGVNRARLQLSLPNWGAVEELDTSDRDEPNLSK